MWAVLGGGTCGCPASVNTKNYNRPAGALPGCGSPYQKAFGEQPPEAGRQIGRDDPGGRLRKNPGQPGRLRPRPRPMAVMPIGARRATATAVAAGLSGSPSLSTNSSRGSAVRFCSSLPTCSTAFTISVPPRQAVGNRDKACCIRPAPLFAGQPGSESASRQHQLRQVLPLTAGRAVGQRRHRRWPRVRELPAGGWPRQTLISSSRSPTVNEWPTLFRATTRHSPLIGVRCMKSFLGGCELRVVG